MLLLYDSMSRLCVVLRVGARRLLPADDHPPRLRVVSRVECESPIVCREEPHQGDDAGRAGAGGRGGAVAPRLG